MHTLLLLLYPFFAFFLSFPVFLLSFDTHKMRGGVGAQHKGGKIQRHRQHAGRRGERTGLVFPLFRYSILHARICECEKERERVCIRCCPDHANLGLLTVHAVCACSYTPSHSPPFHKFEKRTSERGKCLRGKRPGWENKKRIRFVSHFRKGNTVGREYIHCTHDMNSNGLSCVSRIELHFIYDHSTNI